MATDEHASAPPVESHTSTHEYKLHGRKTRFFGRKAELEQLYNALRDAATGGDIRVAHIVGTTGSGKRRLVSEMLELVDVARRGITVLRCGSVAGEPEGSHRFTDQLLRQRFALGSGTQQQLQEQLARGLSGMVAESRKPDAVQLLSHLMSLPVTTGTDGGRATAGLALHERALKTFYNLLRFDASKRPIIIIVEGYENAPQTTREALAGLCAVLRSSPVLVVVASRSDATVSSLAPDILSLGLGALSTSVMTQAAQHLLHGSTVYQRLLWLRP